MILYFTGTGNSRWIAEQLADATHDVVCSIADCLDCEQLPEELIKAEKVGVVFPVHSWYAPRVVIDFLSKLQLKCCKYRYAVCTCGDDMGKGMDRLAKHFPLDAAWSVAMPNTYIPMFNLDTDELCHKKIENARHMVSLIAENVLRQKKEWKVHEGGAAWLKTYVVNPLFVRFVVSAKGFHLDEGCISCGKCSQVCPVKNILITNGSPVWGKQCIHCMACTHACPRKVIQYGKSTRKKGRYRLADYL